MSLNALATAAGLLIAGIAFSAALERMGSEPETLAARSIPGIDIQAAGHGEEALADVNIVGRVLDARGRPVAGVTVMARPQDFYHVIPDAPQSGGAGDTSGSRSLSGGVLTDAEGRFSFSHLRPGAYSFVALHGYYPPGMTSVDLGAGLMTLSPGVLEIVLDATDELIRA